MGLVEQIFIVKQQRGEITELASAELEAGKGIVGDRYHAKAQKMGSEGKAVHDNHISFIAGEELEAFLITHNSDLGFGDFRRSVVTSGIDLNALVGKQFKVGDSVCFGNELCEPCAYLAATVHRAVLPGLVGKGGLRATILSSGSISAGSMIEELWPGEKLAKTPGKQQVSDKRIDSK
ncbi:MAG: MOSC domain-containing protein YiiM [Pseudohongiellaceae bacterium]|jgi:MOSC domain-containing protein YiiM